MEISNKILSLAVSRKGDDNEEVNLVVTLSSVEITVGRDTQLYVVLYCNTFPMKCTHARSGSSAEFTVRRSYVKCNFFIRQSFGERIVSGID